MKIIALEGYANQGKTTVLMKLFHKLCSLYKCKKVESANTAGDINASFEINGKSVGLTTLGDTRQCLEKAFEFFEKERSEIIVLACHKKNDSGKSKQFVVEKDTGAQIIWYTKAVVKQYNNKYNAGKEIDLINDIQASMLLEEIKLQTV